MRPVAGMLSPEMTGLWIALVALAAATSFGLIRKRRDGMLRARNKGESVDPADLGTALGERATLVQFSSAFCAPCRATKRILGEVAGMVEGVTHVEIDAEQNLDLVRRLGILRTPTVLVLDPAGKIVQRASGQPRKADVIAALATTIP
jgi:thiol-disulfide isomerase/thioredoxin